MSTLATVLERRKPRRGRFGRLRGAAGRCGREPWKWFVLALRWGGAAVLVAAVCCYGWLSWRWPVVNDAALMHYVVFLQEHGWAPYREVHDINLPGAWLPDWVAMTLAGSDAGRAADVLWRCYDSGLVGVAATAMVGMTRRQDWFAGVLSGGLFALLHGRDGVGQAGQRDLALAVLFVVAAAAFSEGLRVVEGTRGGVGGRAWLLFGGMGLALGAAATVKPFGAVFFVLLGGWAVVALRGDRRGAWRAGAAAVVGFALPLVAMVVFVVRQGAWASFVTMCRVDLPYHAGAARPPLLGMVATAFHPSILKLSAVPLVILLVRGSWRVRETQVLLVGFGFGLACYFAQNKGYGYQRYPYLVFLLAWVGVECTAALRADGKVLRALGVAGVLVGLCFCVPSYLRSIARAAWPEAYLQAMERDLRAAGGDGLNGRVQCVDSISGCVNVLYRMRLEQATGMMYDEFLFPGRVALGRGEGAPAAVVRGQREFLREIAGRRPEVFVVGSWLFPEGPGEWGKLGLWGDFAGLLDREYRMVDEQRFVGGENGPLGFRVYVLRGR